MRLVVASLLLLVSSLALAPVASADPLDIVDCLDGCYQYCPIGDDPCMWIGQVCAGDLCIPVVGKLFVYVGECVSVQIPPREIVSTC